MIPDGSDQSRSRDHHWDVQLEIRHLKLVAAIAQHGTLTRASAVLHLTQSALSHQLNDLENRFGKRLFRRADRRMIATREGERLAQVARAVLASLVDAARAIRTGEVPAIPVRISTECCTCYHWLPAVFPVFKEEYPGVEIGLHMPSMRDPMEALRAVRLDLAIMSSIVRDRRMVARPLFEDEVLVAVHPHHRFATFEYVPVSELQKETLILYSSTEDSTVMRRVLLPSGVRPAATITHVQLTEAIVELVKANVGIAVLAGWSLKPYLDTGTIRGIRLTAQGCRRQWQAVFPRHLADEDYVHRFCELVASHAPLNGTGARHACSHEPMQQAKKTPQPR